MSDPILHLALRADWEAARAAGVYTTSTRGVTLEQQGFIHCSHARQLRPVADLFYRADAGEVLLLTIDESKLGDTRVVHEEPEPGAGEFPHLYGPLPLDAVVEVTPLRHDEDGRLVLPG